MARARPDIVASWSAPRWAASSDPDEEAVIHCRRVGGLLDLDGGDLLVEVVQRDELSMTAGGVTIVRDPACLMVGGVRLDLDQAVHLAWLLISAREMADAAGRERSEQEREPGQVRLPSVLWSWLHALAKESIHDDL
jgi:hypothetical protein